MDRLALVIAFCSFLCCSMAIDNSTTTENTTAMPTTMVSSTEHIPSTNSPVMPSTDTLSPSPTTTGVSTATIFSNSAIVENTTMHRSTMGIVGTTSSAMAVTMPIQTTGPVTDATTTDITATEGSGSEPNNTMLMPASEALTADSRTTSEIPTSPISTTETSTGFTTTDASTMISLTVGQLAGIGAAGAVMMVLILIVCILCVIICNKLCSRRGKSSTRPPPLRLLSNKKMLESALDEIHLTAIETPASVFAHLEEHKFSPIPVSNLALHVEQLHQDDNFLADEEYDDVKELDQAYNTKAAYSHNNETKNRYTNILPRDETRVTLSTIPKISGSDYINANYIDGFSKANEYVATQGPMLSTCPDFWRMVWELDVSVIVMVTNLEENKTVKCHQYWPGGGTAQYGGVSVELENQMLFPEFIVREMKISYTETKSRKLATQAPTESKTVTQFHFTAWPDFGVPKETSAMIKFVQRVRRRIAPNRGPVVTHCSAGVGRTGTYIAVDILIQRIENGGDICVQEVVARMRAQRGYMVQTSPQYLFIYDSILHYYQHGNKEINMESMKQYVAGLDSPGDDEESLLDKEFLAVMDAKLSQDCFFSVSLDDENRSRNRDPNNIPLDSNRVVLDNCEQDYINASFITGYYNRVEFIATQHPLESTIGDFWTAVVQREVRTIITIGPVQEGTEELYWPTLSSEPREVAGVTVSLFETEWIEESELIIREFTIEPKDGSAFTLMQFHLKSWPAEGPPSGSDPTLDLVHRSRDHWRESGYGLILIHTTPSVKAEATGVYCALCILLRQYEVEGCVNVFTTVTRLRKQRPSIFRSKDYYQFVYKTLVEHHNEQSE